MQRCICYKNQTSDKLSPYKAWCNFPELTVNTKMYWIIGFRFNTVSQLPNINVFLFRSPQRLHPSISRLSNPFYKMYNHYCGYPPKSNLLSTKFINEVSVTTCDTYDLISYTIWWELINANRCKMYVLRTKCPWLYICSARQKNNNNRGTECKCIIYMQRTCYCTEVSVDLLVRYTPLLWLCWCYIRDKL